MTQALIFAAGALSIWLSQSAGEASRKWACALGLASQPLWLAESLRVDQFGIAALSLVYAAAWMRGVHTYWIRA